MSASKSGNSLKKVESSASARRLHGAFATGPWQGVTFADGADVAYRPPAQPYLAPPKEPGKVQRAARMKARRIENRHLAASARKSLVYAGGIDRAAQVSVFASSGAITLAGTVLEVAQIELSQQRARQVLG